MFRNYLIGEFQNLKKHLKDNSILPYIVMYEVEGRKKIEKFLSVVQEERESEFISATPSIIKEPEEKKGK